MKPANHTAIDDRASPPRRLPLAAALLLLLVAFLGALGVWAVLSLLF